MSYHIVHISGRRILSYALLAVVIGSSLGGVLWQLGETYIFHQPFLERFASYQELVTFVQQSPQDVPQSLLEKIQAYFQGFPETLITPQGAAWFRSMESGDAENLEYSTTNIQVEGVDEADFAGRRQDNGEQAAFRPKGPVHRVQAAELKRARTRRCPRC